MYVMLCIVAVAMADCSSDRLWHYYRQRAWRMKYVDVGSSPRANARMHARMHVNIMMHHECILNTHYCTVAQYSHD